jgi:hypothetical protein
MASKDAASPLALTYRGKVCMRPMAPITTCGTTRTGTATVPPMLPNYVQQLNN